MSLGDSIRNFFSKKKSPDLAKLRAFIDEHKGVEGFIEPQTATHPTTLLLVDRIGVSFRGAVASPEDAASFCERAGIPVYDAAVVGYTKRLRDYEMGRRQVVSGDQVDKQIADLEARLDEADPNTPNN
ncbi:MAG: hypothetical protein M3198_04560 [Actinomycetota bacterium]|nr:hypothetical protein [Actinomycetota bacterium]